MNPYFKLLGDLVSLLETPQFAQVIADIQSIEGGAGTHLTTSGASHAVRQVIAQAAQLPPDPTPATHPGQQLIGVAKLKKQ